MRAVALYYPADGSRIPAVYLKDSTLIICSSVNGITNFCKHVQINMQEWIIVDIKQTVKIVSVYYISYPLVRGF